MTTSHFLDAGEWFAGLPGVVIAAGALITDPGERVLLVKPNYRDHWALPGGICEHGEPPHEGCAREVAEEIGLDLVPGALLAIDWAQPFGARQRPIMHFVFDGGQLADGAGIVLQREELDDFRFTEQGELAGYLPPRIEARIRAALTGRGSAATVYRPDPQPG
jgi:8-oxo-dGTP diphosphatase